MDALTQKINSLYTPEQQQAELAILTTTILDMKDHFQLLKLFGQLSQNEENSTFFHSPNCPQQNLKPL
ncbi:hypothetical protein Oweho_3247 [Owenweeksia hongkongensis DSM 17368]|uniref:Uncharacterized protein n=1 Tax=Owenweeksia hongkongensis (strain DSM 17368 / CIP 108786 / JCM 12287 / NRRL B-23963 / UST20020801) TaxID=926562 RepID=G8R498_OWEHD|nr:hypothetical protein [Owenweeksia hongkongensis]AEV34198.1 hypothetical protein Oweho_3247 [Owenweeksia hongkongensis DSM 17368]